MIQEDKPLQNMLKKEQQELVLIFESWKEGMVFLSQQMTKVKGNAFIAPGKSLAAFHSDTCPLIAPFSSLLFLVLIFKAESEYFFLRLPPPPPRGLFLIITALRGWLPPPIPKALIIYKIWKFHTWYIIPLLNKYMFILKYIRKLSGQLISFPFSGSAEICQWLNLKK